MAQPNNSSNLSGGRGSSKIRVRRTRQWRSTGSHAKSGGVYDTEPAENNSNAPVVAAVAQEEDGIADDVDYADALGDDPIEEEPSSDSSNDNQSTSGTQTPDVAKGENNASPTDGQSAAVNDKEKNIAKPTDNSSGNDEDWWKTPRSKRRQGMSNRRKTAVTIAAIGIAVSMFGAVAFLPALVMKQITSKVTEVMMDRVTYIADQRVDVYVKNYFLTKLGVPGERCGKLVTAGCRTVNPTKSLATNLFNSWRDVRFEDKLKEKYGLDFEYNDKSKEFKVFKTNAGGVRGEVGTFGKNGFSNEVSKLMRDSVKNESRFKGIMERRHARSIANRRYGAKKWCFIACDLKDTVADIRIKGVRKIKLKIIARIVEPYSSKAAVVLFCLTVDCSPDEILDSADNAAREIAQRTDKELLERFSKEIGDKKLGQFLLEKIGEKVLSRTLTTAEISAIPLAGQIYLAFVIIDFLDRIDQKIEDRELSGYLRKFNEEAAANYFTIVQTSSEDIQSREATLEDSAAMFSLMRGYDQSRVWQEMNGVQDKNSIMCQDNKVISDNTGELACPEKQMQPTVAIEEIRNNPNVDRILDFVNVYDQCIGVDSPDWVPLVPDCAGVRPKDVIRPLLDGINWAVGGLVGLVFDGVKATPYVGDWVEDVMNWFGEKSVELMGEVAQKIFPLAINGDAEGAEAVDQAFAGADVIANGLLDGHKDDDGTFIGYGTQALSGPQTTELQLAINKERYDSIQNSSMFARYFDLNNTYSLASTTVLRAASALPVVGSQFTLSINPTQSLRGLFSIFGEKRASASYGPGLGLANREKLFGVTQYGIPLNDPVYEVDPESLTPEVCAKYEKEREASKYVDPATGQEKYAKTNICAVDAVVIDSLTKAFYLDGDVTNPTASTTVTTAALGDYKKTIQSDRATSCLGIEQPGAKALQKYVNSVWGGGVGYITNCRDQSTGTGRLSVHAEGRAVDSSFSANNLSQLNAGNETFGWLLTNAEAIGLQYIKFWRVQWSPGKGLSCVTSPSDQQNHSTHIHYELNWAGARQETPYFKTNTGSPSQIKINQDICPVVK